MDTQDEEQIALPDDTIEVGKAAVVRYYADMGRRLEYLQSGILNSRAVGEYIYQAQVRYPTKRNDSHLVILKRLTPDSPQIAFSGGSGLIDALATTGARMRSGSLEWMQDDFPPDEWEERLAWMHKNLYTPHKDLF